MTAMTPTKPWFSVALSCAFALCAWGCGSSNEGRIKTPEDRLAEQEKLAYEDEQRQRSKPKEAAPEAEAERAGAFDKAQTDMELTRATRSAETCSEVVTGTDVPHGETSVTLTFANDGSVGEAQIPAPFAGTRIGECVLNAYKAVIVPPYSGELQVVTWNVSLKAPKPAAPEKSSKKKK
jgi:hypothetical protein